MAIRRRGDDHAHPTHLPASAIASRVSPLPHVAPTILAPSPAMPGLIATEFTYRKDEEIYGEDEPAEYVYQVIRGAVRTYKLLTDGRRQIGAFHLPGDVSVSNSGSAHRLAAEAIIDTTVRLVKRRSLETGRGHRMSGSRASSGP